MSKYLVNASYTSEGTRGLLKEGGTSRQLMVKDMVEKLGGSLEFFYYSFGESDVVAIVDVPDAATATAISMGIKATGAVKIYLTVLITPEEIDKAAKKSIGYRAPGG
ncbi:MAG: GYD domain-containing protein [Cyclobacteriaceae bacterium]|nr:GYD domain-containing protein [Cyclobacteriaceae bacterium]